MTDGCTPRFNSASFQAFNFGIGLSVGDSSIAVISNLTDIAGTPDPISGLGTGTVQFGSGLIPNSGIAGGTFKLATVELSLLTEGVTSLTLFDQNGATSNLDFINLFSPGNSVQTTFDSYGSATITAVPEPTSLALVGLASAGAFCNRRVRGLIRRKKQTA